MSKKSTDEAQLKWKGCEEGFLEKGPGGGSGI